MNKVRIVSDGTASGTKVTLNDVDVPALARTANGSTASDTMPRLK